MNKSLVLITFLVLALALVTSNVVYADSKIINKIDKALKKYADEKKEKDLCFVIAGKKSDLDGKKVWSRDCEPQAPVNKKPVVQTIDPISAVINETVTVDVVATDEDGNITDIVWDGNAPFTSNGTHFEFISQVNGTFDFSVKAVDNEGASDTEKFTIVVGTVTPEPEPNPSDNITSVILVGDLKGSSVPNIVGVVNPDLLVALGDISYTSNTNDWLSYLNTLSGKAQSFECVVGNHDVREDGSAELEKISLDKCGSGIWTRVLPQTIIIGFNSNGDINAQIDQVKAVDISGYKNVVVVSHKPCVAPPNSHHPVSEAPDVKKFCDAVGQLVSNGQNLYLASGHNHVSAKSEDGKMFVSGGGGRSHYNCGTDSTWTFCENQKYGYLLLLIDDNTGEIDSKFIDTNGVVMGSG